jgi:hypothetical protein
MRRVFGNLLATNWASPPPMLGTDGSSSTSQTRTWAAPSFDSEDDGALSVTVDIFYYFGNIEDTVRELKAKG